MDLKLSPLLRIALLGMPATLHAAGFSLLEQSGSGIGYAYAGAAAAADDASAMFFNPAALTLLGKPQIVVAAHGINLETKFSDRGSVLPPAGLGLLPTGATRDNAGDTIAVPNAYLAWPINDRLSLGFGVNVPFGLVTDYDDPWIGRFQGLRSELKTLNANPALAYRVNDFVSIGLGVNYQRAEAELSNAVMLGAGLEGRALLDVDDEAWGWNAGVIFTLPSSTRIGLSYRSKLDYTLTGDTTVRTLAGTTIPTVSGPTSVDITFPDSAQLSAVQPIGAAFELRADVNWMNWSEIGAIFPLNTATGLPRDVLNFAFEDTVRVALGVGYKWNERWTWRAGIAWDESPVKDEVRTVRLPDGDRKWLTVGARWQPAEKVSIDAGYAHLLVDNTSVNLTREQLGAPASFGSVVSGGYDNAVDILSVQLNWSFH
jgi:long-chain fatty acid transport protein